MPQERKPDLFAIYYYIKELTGADTHTHTLLSHLSAFITLYPNICCLFIRGEREMCVSVPPEAAAKSRD